MTRGRLDVNSLTQAQAAQYAAVKANWGEMSKVEVMGELDYYAGILTRLPAVDPARKRFQTEHDNLTTYLNLFPVPAVPTPVEEELLTE